MTHLVLHYLPGNYSCDAPKNGERTKADEDLLPDRALVHTRLDHAASECWETVRRKS